MANFRTKITGTGSYIPELVKTNRDFTIHDFYDEKHVKIDSPPDVVVRKFYEITGIEERRYASENLNNSDLGYFAAKKAIENSKINPEMIDQIIVAHNYGDVCKHTIQCDTVPSLASRIKHSLGVKNPACIAHDVLFGCPGWLQGVIHADAFFKSGLAKTALVIGTETLSRVIDVYDRDSMIFSDGAGAVILQYLPSDDHSGIMSVCAQSHCVDEMGYIHMGKSYFPQSDPRIRYIKMKGRKVYEYAMKQVPLAMKECIDKAGVGIEQITKIFLHQANEKMDEAITKALYRLYGITDIPADIMPMSINKLGNSSVATIPTLFDLVKNRLLGNHELHTGDIVLFASVGAGMNINAVCYKI